MVVGFVWSKRFIVSSTDASDIVSSADVISSNRSIDAFFISARAIDIFCLCPPERFIPLSPARVLYP